MQMNGSCVLRRMKVKYFYVANKSIFEAQIDVERRVTCEVQIYAAHHWHLKEHLLEKLTFDVQIGFVH